MKVVVPTVEPDCPATRAIRMEGIDVIEEVIHSDTGYAELFTELWNIGEPFVTCEHDVVPWPGAIDGLMHCPEPWCTHRFPNGGNLMLSFGIGKYTPQGSAPEEWLEPRWHGRMLDGAVLPYLRFKLFMQPHVHEPPVAHCRANPRGAIKR